MNKKTPSIWQDTPATSERIVTAIARIASVLRAGSWQFATEVGLNATQVDILNILQSRSEAVRLTWVAQQLGVTSATASDSMASLTSKGLIKKSRATDDGRAIALSLTTKGRTLAVKISDAMQFAHQAVNQLSTPTQDNLFSALLNLIGELQKSERFPEIRACVSCQYFAINSHPGQAAPHHCLLVDAPLSVNLLRLDCPEHQAAPDEVSLSNWKKINIKSIV